MNSYLRKLDHVTTSQTQLAKALNFLSHSTQHQTNLPIMQLNAIEEFSEREHCKCNVIVFNLKESTTANADKDSFIELCCTGLKLEVEVAKFFWLRKAVPDKIRPLLITTAMVDSKMNMLKSTHQLHSTDQYEMFIFHLTELGRKGRALRNYKQSSSIERMMVNQI